MNFKLKNVINPQLIKCLKYNSFILFNLNFIILGWIHILLMFIKALV